MGEPKDQELDLQPGEAGLAFRAEMAATQVLLGYWKVAVALLIAGLLGVLFYGQYVSWVQRTQRHLAAQIAEVERELPVALVQIPEAQQAGDATITAELLSSTAEKIEAVARAGAGPASVEGLLKAAELYRLAGAPDRQRAALEAGAGDARGVLTFAVEGALANLDLEQGRGEDAVRRLQTLMDTSDGYLGQQAAMDLGMALEHLGRSAEADQVYARFLETWPDSARSEEVHARRARLGGNE